MSIPSSSDNRRAYVETFELVRCVAERDVDERRVLTCRRTATTHIVRCDLGTRLSRSEKRQVINADDYV